MFFYQNNLYIKSKKKGLQMQSRFSIVTASLLLGVSLMTSGCGSGGSGGIIDINRNGIVDAGDVVNDMNLTTNSG